MAAQKGKDLLLKLDSNGSGTFVTVAGLRSRVLAFNAQAIDITDMESAGEWRELLDGGGIKRAGITGSGIFRDAASDALLRQYFFDGTIRDFEVTIPEFGVLTGRFQITALEFTGRHDGELSFDMALESAGQLSFAAL